MMLDLYIFTIPLALILSFVSLLISTSLSSKNDSGKWKWLLLWLTLLIYSGIGYLIIEFVI